MLVDALHAALEDRIEAFNRIGVDRITDRKRILAFLPQPLTLLTVWAGEIADRG